MSMNTTQANPSDRVRVLVVDDDPDIVEMLLALSARNPTVEVMGASTPEIAMSVSRHEPPDVILLDHHFRGPQPPDLDDSAARQGRGLSGLEAVEFLRAAAPDALIAIYTGAAGLADSAEHAGADLYLEKGLDPGSMLDEVAGRARQRREA